MPSSGVTPHGAVATDLQSLVDCQYTTPPCSPFLLLLLFPLSCSFLFLHFLLFLHSSSSEEIATPPRQQQRDMYGQSMVICMLRLGESRDSLVHLSLSKPLRRHSYVLQWAISFFLLLGPVRFIACNSRIPCCRCLLTISACQPHRSSKPVLLCFITVVPTPEEYRVPRVVPGVTASKVNVARSRSERVCVCLLDSFGNSQSSSRNPLEPGSVQPT